MMHEQERATVLIELTAEYLRQFLRDPARRTREAREEFLLVFSRCLDLLVEIDAEA